MSSQVTALQLEVSPKMSSSTNQTAVYTLRMIQQAIKTEGKSNIRRKQLVQKERERHKIDKCDNW